MDARAQYNLGIIFRDGLGVKKDDVQSLIHFVEAALRGHVISPVEIGKLYFKGTLTEKVFVFAHFLWSLARDRNA